jgi:argonaute-like protein implicated in RNA metabolism and viral defense
VRNDYTGLESSTDEELVNECYRTFDSGINRPLELALAQRLDAAIDETKLVSEYEALDINLDEIKELQGALIDNTDTTVVLLKLLAEFEIDSVDYLRATLQAAKIINEAA